MRYACRLQPIFATVLYISSKHAMRAPVHVSLRPEGSAIIFRVADQGRGFADDVLRRLNMGAVTDMDTKHPVSALSVGLTGCKRLCESLRCELTISNASPENAKRKGGVVTVQIPVQ